METRIQIFTLSAALFLFSLADVSGQGGAFPKTSDAPKPSKTPRTVDLRSAPGSENALKARASFAEIRLESDSSRGAAGMTGRMNVFRKFIRVEISNAPRISPPSLLKVKYDVEEDGGRTTKEESVPINLLIPHFTVDTPGFEDTYGTDVKSSIGITTISSTKYKYPEANIVSLHVTVTDKDGNELFLGSWPSAETRGANLPDHLKVRTFTSTDGKKLQASVGGVDGNNVTLMINGKPFNVDLSKLSAGDQEFLKKIQSKSGP